MDNMTEWVNAQDSKWVKAQDVKALQDQPSFTLFAAAAAFFKTNGGKPGWTTCLVRCEDCRKVPAEVNMPPDVHLRWCGDCATNHLEARTTA